MAFEFRQWQKEAVERAGALKRSIIEACPGSGKSSFSGALSKLWLDSSQCDHVLAVTPSVNIKRGIMRQWAGNFGFKVRGNLVKRSVNAFKVPEGYDATVITYHELKNEQCIDVLRLWLSKNFRFGVIFDEVHHAARSQTWGDVVRVIGHDLASRVCIMTGTAFRSDGQPIELMEYITHDGESVANPDYRYLYRQAVNDDICRPVTCLWIDGELTFSHHKKEIYNRTLSKVQPYEMNEAMRMFFNPAGECMENMVRQVHSDLMRLRDTDGYKDAAALFVCRPGGPNNEENDASEKHVREMAKLIERITKQEVVVVTHDEEGGADKLDAFARGTSPYLVAVNMVSEGVDIPRIRKVAFCRYTDSEMLFRQICGRALRKTRDNDPVAAQIYIPAFPKMVEFGQRLWDEAKAGLVNKVERARERDGEGEWPKSPKLVGIDATGDATGGHYDQTSVAEGWVKIAGEVVNTHEAFRSWDRVQLGAALQVANGIQEGNSSDRHVSRGQSRKHLCDRLLRRVNRLATLAYGGDYGKAWATELFEKFNVNSLDDIRVLWTDNQILTAARELEKRIDAVAHRRSEDQ